MKRFSIFFFLISATVTFSAYAYEYTFNNKSDKDAVVQFKLAADIVAGFKEQNITVRANSSASISIPEWWRAGLALDLDSVKIKFLPDGAFQAPWRVYNSDWFDHVVRTKEMPTIYKALTAKRAAIPADHDWSNGTFYKILFYNRNFDFAYTTQDTYPVLKFTP